MPKGESTTIRPDHPDHPAHPDHPRQRHKEADCPQHRPAEFQSQRDTSHALGNTTTELDGLVLLEENALRDGVNLTEPFPDKPDLPAQRPDVPPPHCSTHSHRLNSMSEDIHTQHLGVQKLHDEMRAIRAIPR